MEEVFGMMGVMFATTLDTHRPHISTPGNIGVMTLQFLDFMINTCSDFDIERVQEVVRVGR
jgi:hypothetical protein